MKNRWYNIAFKLTVEHRFPSSSEVDAARDLNIIPAIHPVARLTEVYTTDRISFYISESQQVKYCFL